MRSYNGNSRNRFLNLQHQPRFSTEEERFRISWAFRGEGALHEVFARNEEAARIAREALHGNDRIRQVSVHRISDGERIEFFNREIPSIAT